VIFRVYRAELHQFLGDQDINKIGKIMYVPFGTFFIFRVYRAELHQFLGDQDINKIGKIMYVPFGTFFMGIFLRTRLTGHFQYFSQIEEARARICLCPDCPVTEKMGL